MLRKKNIYRKELDFYMYISQLYAKLNWIDVLHIWCKVSMISLLNQILARLN